MNNSHKKNKILGARSGGFTLIETMIAIFILTVAVAGLLGLTSRSLFSARYANNEITANYLLQEAIDAIRNDRDTIAFQQNGADGGWDAFVKKYDACFSDNGCSVEPAASDIPAACGTGNPSFGSLACPVFNYDDQARHNSFYTYKDGEGIIESKFKRQVLMSLNESNEDELDIKVTVEWENGSLVRSGFIYYSLLNWQK
ncbi:MAG: prepilin-type N-terminal cleavage/methylation domain-containing protein [Patescibacteria group bacterium]